MSKDVSVALGGVAARGAVTPESFAEAVKVLTVQDKLWLIKSLQDKKKQLLRSRQSEVSGSDIWTLRTKEIVAIDGLVLTVQSW